MKFKVMVAPGLGDCLGAYTFFSLPLPRGQFRGQLEAQVEGMDNATELWPLAYWPDGSVRMVQGLMQRQQSLHTMEIIPSRIAATEMPLLGDSFTFGGHDATRSQGTQMFRLSYGGLEYFNPDRFCQNFTTLSGQPVLCHPEDQIRMVAYRRNWIRLENFLIGKAIDESVGLRFRLQWDLFSGVPGCVLSVMVIHDQPDSRILALQGIETEIGLAAKSLLHGVQQLQYGFEYTKNRCVETAESLDLRVADDIFSPRIANFEALGDTEEYPSHLHSPPDRVSAFCWLRGGGRRLILEMENFALLRPKGILLKGSARIGIWPDWAGSVKWPQGRRRQVRIAVAVEPDDLGLDSTRLQARTAALLDTWRVTPSAAAYREARFFDLPWLPPCRPDRNPRIEGWASRVSSLKTPPEFFNLGDTVDSHYTRTYYPIGRVPLKSGATDAPPKLAISSGRNAIASGAMDAREPVYVNNEYDVLHCLAGEYLRTGNSVLFRQLLWFARHTIEVDFFCYNDSENLHRAQGVHSVGHTSLGAFPSHFWTQGLAQYYFLTGDADALEVIRALAEKTIWYFEHPQFGKLGTGINREMGWAVLTLVSSYEATLQPEFLRYARKLIDNVRNEPLPDDLPMLNFGHTSLLLGCKAYLEAAEHSPDSTPVREWYLRVVRLALHSAWYLPMEANGEERRSKLSYDYDRLDRGPADGQRPRSGILHGYAALACLAYAWRLTGEESFLNGGLRTVRAFFDDTPGYFQFFRTSIPEGKPFAWSYRTMMEFFQALDENGLLREFELR